MLWRRRHQFHLQRELFSSRKSERLHHVRVIRETVRGWQTPR
jgi:hypothetical protein